MLHVAVRLVVHFPKIPMQIRGENSTARYPVVGKVKIQINMERKESREIEIERELDKERERESDKKRVN